MRRSKLLRLFAILFAIALIAAACGDDDDDTASGDDGSASSDDGSGDDGSGDDGSGDDGSGDDGSGDDGSGDDGSGDDGSGDDGASDDGGELTVPSNPDNGVTDDAIKVGWMGDLTGPTASSQSFNSHGSEAYFTCLNERGGLLGRTVDYIPEDDEFSAETAAVNFASLVDDEQVIALVGLGGSHISTQLVPQIEELGLPVIGPPQTIDVQFTGDHVFNNLAHYGDQGDIAAATIGSELGGLENAVVVGISLEVPSGQEYQTYVQDAVQNGGGTFVTTLFIAPGATEATAQMVELQQLVEDEGVNYITLHGSPGSNLVVAQAMADVGLSELPVVGIHGVASNSLFTEGPTDIVDQVAGAHSFLSANNDSDQAAEMGRCAELAGYAGEEFTLNFAHGWVNGMIFEQAAIRAAEQSGELTRETLTEALRGTFDTGGLSCPVDWTNGQHSPCGAAMLFDFDAGGFVPANSFDFYADVFDGVYGLEFTQ